MSVIKNVRGYSELFKQTAFFDRIQYLRITNRFYSDSDFEMTLTLNDYVWNDIRNTDYIVFEGIRGVFRIRSRQIHVTGKSQTVTLAGSDATYLMNNRIVLDIPVFYGPSYTNEVAIKYLIGRNMLIQHGGNGSPIMWVDRNDARRDNHFVKDIDRVLPFVRVKDWVEESRAPKYYKNTAGNANVPSWTAFHNLSDMVRGVLTPLEIGMYATLWEATTPFVHNEVTYFGGVTYNINMGDHRGRGYIHPTILYSPKLDNISEWRYVQAPDGYVNHVYMSHKLDWKAIKGPLRNRTDNVHNGWLDRSGSTTDEPRYTSAHSGIDTRTLTFQQKVPVYNKPSGVHRREGHEWVSFNPDVSADINDRAYALSGESQSAFKYEYKNAVNGLLYQRSGAKIMSQRSPFVIEMVVEPTREPVPNIDYYAGDYLTIQLPIYGDKGYRYLQATEITTVLDGKETVTVSFQENQNEDPFLDPKDYENQGLPI